MAGRSLLSSAKWIIVFVAVFLIVGSILAVGQPEAEAPDTGSVSDVAGGPASEAPTEPQLSPEAAFNKDGGATPDNFNKLGNPTPDDFAKLKEPTADNVGKYLSAGNNLGQLQGDSFNKALDAGALDQIKTPGQLGKLEPGQQDAVLGEFAKSGYKDNRENLEGPIKGIMTTTATGDGRLSDDKSKQSYLGAVQQFYGGDVTKEKAVLADDTKIINKYFELKGQSVTVDPGTANMKAQTVGNTVNLNTPKYLYKTDENGILIRENGQPVPVYRSTTKLEGGAGYYVENGDDVYVVRTVNGKADKSHALPIDGDITMVDNGNGAGVLQIKDGTIGKEGSSIGMDGVINGMDNKGNLMFQSVDKLGGLDVVHKDNNPATVSMKGDSLNVKFAGDLNLAGDTANADFGNTIVEAKKIDVTNVEGLSNWELRTAGKSDVVYNYNDGKETQARTVSIDGGSSSYLTFDKEMYGGSDIQSKNAFLLGANEIDARNPEGGAMSYKTERDYGEPPAAYTEQVNILKGGDSSTNLDTYNNKGRNFEVVQTDPSGKERRLSITSDGSAISRLTTINADGTTNLDKVSTNFPKSTLTYVGSDGKEGKTWEIGQTEEQKAAATQAAKTNPKSDPATRKFQEDNFDAVKAAWQATYKNQPTDEQVTDGILGRATQAVKKALDYYYQSGLDEEMSEKEYLQSITDSNGWGYYTGASGSLAGTGGAPAATSYDYRVDTNNNVYRTSQDGKVEKKVGDTWQKSDISRDTIMGSDSYHYYSLPSTAPASTKTSQPPAAPINAPPTPSPIPPAVAGSLEQVGTAAKMEGETKTPSDVGTLPATGPIPPTTGEKTASTDTPVIPVVSRPKPPAEDSIFIPNTGQNNPEFPDVEIDLSKKYNYNQVNIPGQDQPFTIVTDDSGQAVGGLTTNKDGTITAYNKEGKIVPLYTTDTSLGYNAGLTPIINVGDLKKLPSQSGVSLSPQAATVTVPQTVSQSISQPFIDNVVRNPPQLLVDSRSEYVGPRDNSVTTEKLKVIGYNEYGSGIYLPGNGRQWRYNDGLWTVPIPKERVAK